MSDDIIEGVREIADFSDRKRPALMDRATARQSTSRHLHFLAAGIALLSSAGMTVVLTSGSSSLTLKVVTPLIAFAAGIINLVSTIYYDARETTRMFKGAASFLALKSKAELLLLSPPATLKGLFDAYKKLVDTYQSRSGDYDPLTGPSSVQRLHLSVKMRQAAGSGSGGRSSSCIQTDVRRF